MITFKQTKILKTTKFGIVTLCALMFSINLSATTQSTQSTVENKIHQYIRTQIEPNPNKKIEIIVTPIDKRRKLTQCLTPLEINLAGKQSIRRNNTVSVICKDQWKLYVSVRVKTLMAIVTATNNLSPGTRLSEDNLQMQYFDISTLRGETTLSIAAVVGSRVKRHVQQGRPLLSSLICLVCKGDPVSLYVRNNHLSIKSSGTALSDGSMGQIIAAKNNSSGRRVEGRVVAVGEIEIN